MSKQQLIDFLNDEKNNYNNIISTQTNQIGLIEQAIVQAQNNITQFQNQIIDANVTITNAQNNQNLLDDLIEIVENQPS
jgi:hypothetical protein